MENYCEDIFLYCHCRWKLIKDVQQSGQSPHHCLETWTKNHSHQVYFGPFLHNQWRFCYIIFRYRQQLCSSFPNRMKMIYLLIEPFSLCSRRASLTECGIAFRVNIVLGCRVAFAWNVLDNCCRSFPPL